MRSLVFLMILLVGLAGHRAALGAEPGADPAPLNIGDRLVVTVPGETAFDKPFDIGRDGAIVLPEVGAINVAGLTESEARDRILATLRGAFRNAEGMEIHLLERRLVVTVLGYVNRPGPVNLEADATVQMALQAAGGLAQGAQLDQIQLRRNGTVTAFDYKRYLDSGDPQLVPRLLPADVVFVPASPLTGNVQVEFDARTLTAAGDAGDDSASVTVFGEVHRPGTFSFKEGNTVVDLLMRAGGVTRYAGVEQIRVISSGAPQPFNMREYLDSGDRALMPAIGPGDIVFVPQATEAVKAGSRTVYVMGEVFKPGAYETEAGTTFLDILANAGGPTRYAETRQIRVLRKDGRVEPFDLQAYTEGASGKTALPGMAAGDAILVPEKTDMNEKSWLKVAPGRAIRIIGAVHRPGRYEWSDEMTLLDLIAHAGGPREGADAAHVQVLPPPGAREKGPIKFDLQRFVDEGGAETDLPRVAAGYTVVVPELPKDPNDNRSQWVRQSSERSIYVFGEVGAPGRYAFNEGLNFLDILSAANGPTAKADLRHIRVSHRGAGRPRLTQVNLALYFETGDERLLPKVRPEDVIYVPDQNRAWLDKEPGLTVRVLGAIGKPGRYAFDDNMTILDLLAQAGGPTANAYQNRILVVNQTRGEPVSHSFDLVSFAKSGNFTQLPVLRAGDTVYVPDKEESPGNQFRTALRDIISLITIGALAF